MSPGAPGIHCLAVPTPFAVGDVNAYLIEDQPLTLVDRGPNSAESLDALELQLANHGYALEQLDLILVTHEHSDHLGLAHAVASRSGARIACLDRLTPYAANLDAATSRDRETAATLMLRHGVDAALVAAIRKREARAPQWGHAFRADVSLEDGAVLELRDRRLRVVHVPGHSATDTLFHDEQNGVVFTGDHLLARISSNAFVTSRLYDPWSDERRSGRRRALVEYVRALEQTRELEVELALAGHGPAIADHRGLIDERLREIETRALRILELVKARSRSAHEIARALWRERARTQPLLTLSEVLGHLDRLADDDLVVERSHGSVNLFAAA